MVDSSSVRRTRAPGRGRCVLALGVLALTACASPDATSDVVVDPPIATADPLVEAATQETVAVDLASFAPIDRTTWDEIVADPDAAAGERVVVYACITRFYDATGPGTVQAHVTTTQPADPTEGRGSILRAEPALLAGVGLEDVLRVHVEVVGTFGGDAGAFRGVPELVVHAAEPVGLRDLTADVTLSRPISGDRGGITVPVSVQNSGELTYDYRVDLVAVSPDDERPLAHNSVWVSHLAPGQSGVAEGRFPEDLPRDASFRVADVSRAVPAG